jgi:hypothetical protein
MQPALGGLLDDGSASGVRNSNAAVSGNVMEGVMQGVAASWNSTAVGGGGDRGGGGGGGVGGGDSSERSVYTQQMFTDVNHLLVNGGADKSLTSLDSAATRLNGMLLCLAPFCYCRRTWILLQYKHKQHRYMNAHRYNQSVLTMDPATHSAINCDAFCHQP